jgi:phage/plasmid-associated DNA primase
MSFSNIENKYIVYSIITYEDANAKFIEENKIIYDDVDELVEKLKKNKGYHFRIHKNTQYIFFGDLDDYPDDINRFIEILQDFLKKYYDLDFTKDEFFYTQNNKKETSYHYSIPKWNLSTEKLKEIHTNLLKLYPKDFMTKVDQKIKRNIDTTIYSEHWFRCPNQKKGQKINDDTKHIIITGELKNFVIDYIDVDSKNINDVEFTEEISAKTKKEKNSDKLTKQSDLIKFGEKKNLTKDQVLSSTISQPNLYKKMFDECYKQERFETYEFWMSIGMAIKNTFSDENVAFDLFNYFSSKGNNYEGIYNTQQKFNTFIKKQTIDKYTVATIYYYAIEDNKIKFIEIMNKNTFDLEQADICKYVKALAGKKFIYIIDNGVYKLYCFNGKIWKNDDILMKHFLSNELYEFLKMILVELYFEHHTFNQMKSQIKRLKTIGFKKDVVESYKEIGINEKIKFDDKWNLFGFNNLVYDLETEEFREYCYEDCVSTTVGYEWREPTQDEYDTINRLIVQIMPIKEERDLYLQILSTALDGRCLEKFIIFNGSGGNGKGMMNDLLLLALGNYGMIGNNAILSETNKSGSNPEKANIHKKRLVIFREPSEKNKFENSIIKELTGGGTFSARGHHESATKKELNLTMIVECNKKPLFTEEPEQSEIRRLIDLYFRTTYTHDPKLVDETNNIFIANPYYKEKQFQETHKFALLKILMEEHKKYKKNNCILILPKSIENRTQLYLELSCNVLSWFKDNYEFTENKEDICKIKDLYSDFTTSIYFSNLSKQEKKKYTKSYFNEYIENNIFFKKYYTLKSQKVRNFISQWKKINDNEFIENESEEHLFAKHKCVEIFGQYYDTYEEYPLYYYENTNTIDRVIHKIKNFKECAKNNIFPVAILDIACIKNNKFQFGIEIKKTHKVDDKKIGIIKKMNNLCKIYEVEYEYIKNNNFDGANIESDKNFINISK